MEVIIFILISWFVVTLFFKFMNLVGKLDAGVKSVSGSPNTSNIRLLEKESPPVISRDLSTPFTLRSEKVVKPGFTVINIQGKGILFTAIGYSNTSFVTSVLDRTSGENEAVMSLLERLQEVDNVCYQNRRGLGEIRGIGGFTDWVTIGLIIPELLQPPRSGLRKIRVVVRLIDEDDPPVIKHGFRIGESGTVILSSHLDLDLQLDEEGYQEESEHNDEARAISVKIGVAIAMADGEFHDNEGNVIKTWIQRLIEPFSDQKRFDLKTLYNEAMSDAYREARGNGIRLTELTERLNEIAEKSIKYETLELCFDIMAADGKVHADELLTIRSVAEALELDIDEVEKMKDQSLLKLDSSNTEQASVENILGINPQWSDDKVKKHLRAEFQKWNDRLTTLSEGEEQDNAQRMLDIIAEARKQYV